MDKREDIIRKIVALQERTVEQGCSEAEAMSAARLAGRLLALHGLAMSDLEIEETVCEKGEINTGRKRDHEIVGCLNAIGMFTDCKIWKDRSGEKLKYCFFGFPEDVTTAKWLYSLVLASMGRELVQYKAKCWFEDVEVGRRQTHAFLLGMVKRVATRLRELKKEQEREIATTTGRELVVMKGAVVREQVEKLGLNLRKKKSGQYSRDTEAYAAGGDAGDRVGFNKGVRETKLLG